MDKKDGLISYATDIGLRPYQEDRFVVCSDGEHPGIKLLMAVMDGHGGPEVSEFLSASLLEYFLTKGGGSLRETIRLLSEQTELMEAGSTLSVVVISKADETTAYIAVIGDSPVIVRDKEGRIIMSPEHNVRSNAQERDASIDRGAIYEGGYIWDPFTGRGLQMSRALGDSALSKVLSREPEIYEVELGPESFIIIGSDGLFDPSHADTKNQMERLVQMVSGGADAQDLVNDALVRRTGDNVTAIVWRAK